MEASHAIRRLWIADQEEEEGDEKETDVGKEGIKEGESVVEELGNVALEFVIELVVRGRGGIGLVLEL